MYISPPGKTWWNGMLIQRDTLQNWTGDITTLHSRWFVLEPVANLWGQNIQSFFFFPPVFCYIKGTSCLKQFWPGSYSDCVVRISIKPNRCGPQRKLTKLGDRKVGRVHIPDQAISGLIVPQGKHISMYTSIFHQQLPSCYRGKRDQDRSSFNSTHQGCWRPQTRRRPTSPVSPVHILLVSLTWLTGGQSSWPHLKWKRRKSLTHSPVWWHRWYTDLHNFAYMAKCQNAPSHCPGVRRHPCEKKWVQ